MGGASQAALWCASGTCKDQEPMAWTSAAASVPPACHPLPAACLLELPGQPQGPHCTAIAAFACLASLAFPMPANSPPPPPPHAAGWAPGTGGPAPLGLETVLGSVRHIRSSSCRPQQAGKPDGVPPALPTTIATPPWGVTDYSQPGKGKGILAMAVLPLRGRRKGLPSPSSGQGAGGVPRGQ